MQLSDGGQIALYHYPNKTSIGLPVLITHGSLSAGDTVQDIISCFSDSDCWMFEWGGHGASTVSSSKNNFEHVAQNDIPTAINEVLQRTGAPSLFLVTHSGGGLLSLMYLARNLEQQTKLAGLVTMGAQTTQMALTIPRKIALWLFRAFILLFNYTPAVGAGNEPEQTRGLAQWSTWNIEEKWLGSDGFDYMDGLKNLIVPIFMLAAQGDNVAPVQGCAMLHANYGGPKDWLLCGLKTGFSKDFTHGQLIRGSGARQEVLPRVKAWVDKQRLS